MQHECQYTIAATMQGQRRQRCTGLCMRKHAKCLLMGRYTAKASSHHHLVLVNCSMPNACTMSFPPGIGSVLAVAMVAVVAVVAVSVR